MYNIICKIPVLGALSVMFARYILCNGQFVIELVIGTITNISAKNLVPESQINADKAKLAKIGCHSKWVFYQTWLTLVL